MQSSSQLSSMIPSHLLPQHCTHSNADLESKYPQRMALPALLNNLRLIITITSWRCSGSCALLSAVFSGRDLLDSSTAGFQASLIYRIAFNVQQHPNGLRNALWSCIVYSAACERAGAPTAKITSRSARPHP